MKNLEPKDRIIVALDVDNLEKAKPLVETLSPFINCFKVGLELMTAVGAPQAVKAIHQFGGKVFLDGKFNDIPNTIAAASRAAAQLNVKMFDVHASSGIEAMKAAVANKGNALILVVTVLTALDEKNTQYIFGNSSQNKVLQFALDAKQVGAGGIICSPQELDLLSSHKEFEDFWKITPGIRPQWAAMGDQKRVLTPKEALKKGATALVIGRPITNPPTSIGTPVDAVKRILDEII